MNELAIVIDMKNKLPMYKQIYLYIKNAIVKGEMCVGEALPSSRVLTKCLKCSRNTVLMAYDQLVAEGYVETKPRKGYYVTELERQFNKY